MVETRSKIAGILIDSVTMSEAVHRIENIIANNDSGYVVTPNVDHIVKLQDDREFREIYENAALVLPDGLPILWAARFLGCPLKEKVSGSDLFPQLCEYSAVKGYRLFFLGGRPGAAEECREILTKKFANIVVSGCYSPPMGFENDIDENDKIVDMIKNAKPDILFVGLGAPKQEKWISRFIDDLQVPVAIGIGVSFEFTAGMVRRAPVWMQRVGLEWFWRLIMEPRRLWKRYLIDDMAFIGLILRQKFSKSPDEKKNTE